MTESLSAILGKLPSGLFVLTARHGAAETGMLSSWVMQAGFEPPMLTVALRHGRYLNDWLAAGAQFVLNVLPEKNKTLLRHFARGFEEGEPAFEGLAIERTARGTPVLLGTVGHLECEVAGHCDSPDHRVYLAAVVGGTLRDQRRPMVHIRHSGMRY